MIPSAAGAMFSTGHTHPLPSHEGSTSHPRSQTRRKPASPPASIQGDETEKKPKKVNSEIRKQQNRIASRNYREKRKRKLQYLQQLIVVGRSYSPQGQTRNKLVAGGNRHDHQIQSQSQQSLASPNQRPQLLPSNGNTNNENTATENDSTAIFLPSQHFAPILPTSNSNNPTTLFPAPPATTTTTTTSYTHHSAQLPPSSYSYSPPTWTATPSLYDMTSWNNLSSAEWIPNIEYSPPMTTRSADDFQFTPPPPAPPSLAFDSFDQLPTPPRQAYTPEPDFYFASMGGGAGGGPSADCRRPHGGGVDFMGAHSVSLPTTPFSHPR